MGNIILLVLLDLLAAFDTINLSLLLSQISGLGMRTLAHQRLQSVLDGHVQEVQLGELESLRP